MLKILLLNTLSKDCLKNRQYKKQQQNSMEKGSIQLEQIIYLQSLKSYR